MDSCWNVIERQEKAVLSLLEDARGRLEIEKDDWAKTYLRITAKDYEEILARKRTLSAASLYYLTEKLWINPSDLENGNIDFDAIVRIHKGEENFLNPRYTVAARSRKHTVLNSLNFVEADRGTYLRNSVNRHFQIRDDFWSTGIMDPINIRFVSDLMRYLGQRGFKENEFKAMGMNSFRTLKSTPVGTEFARARSLTELFDLTISDLIHRIEDNCDYRLVQMTDGGCVIESITNRDVADALETTQVGSQEVCQYRAGVFVSMPGYIGGTPASVFETHCVHRGDQQCRFVVDFSHRHVRDNGVRLSRVV